MKRTGVRIALLLLTSGLPACNEANVKPPEHLADAYAEILLASNIYRSDSSRLQTILDSIATNFGFRDQKDVLSEIHQVTLNPEILRKVLDSTQNRLQRMQEGENAKGPR